MRTPSTIRKDWTVNAHAREGEIPFSAYGWDIVQFLKCKQGEKESLLDYLSRFKSERDVLYRILGKKFLNGFTENLPGWNGDTMSDDAKKKFKEKELNKFLAVLFLQNADYGTYNYLLVEYRWAYANKQDIYPKSLEDVLDVMRQV